MSINLLVSTRAILIKLDFHHFVLARINSKLLHEAMYILVCIILPGWSEFALEFTLVI
jgi:hypothetical protein